MSWWIYLYAPGDREEGDFRVEQKLNKEFWYSAFQNAAAGDWGSTEIEKSLCALDEDRQVAAIKLCHWQKFRVLQRYDSASLLKLQDSGWQFQVRSQLDPSSES